MTSVAKYSSGGLPGRRKVCGQAIETAHYLQARKNSTSTLTVEQPIKAVPLEAGPGARRLSVINNGGVQDQTGGRENPRDTAIKLSVVSAAPAQ